MRCQRPDNLRRTDKSIAALTAQNETRGMVTQMNNLAQHYSVLEDRQSKLDEAMPPHDA